MNFDIIKPLFKGSFSASQMNGLLAIIKEGVGLDKRHLAYVLATVFHETGRKMQPCRECGGDEYLQSRKYYPYYGRDLVQTTWRHNYEKVYDYTGVDVVNDPELIGQMPLAAEVAIVFMKQGWFTGKKLSDYFNDTKEDPIWARSIINGKRKGEKLPDKAELIASYYEVFKAALCA